MSDPAGPNNGTSLPDIPAGRRSDTREEIASRRKERLENAETRLAQEAADVVAVTWIRTTDVSCLTEGMPPRTDGIDDAAYIAAVRTAFEQGFEENLAEETREMCELAAKLFAGRSSKALASFNLTIQRFGGPDLDAWDTGSLLEAATKGAERLAGADKIGRAPPLWERLGVAFAALHGHVERVSSSGKGTKTPAAAVWARRVAEHAAKANPEWGKPLPSDKSLAQYMQDGEKKFRRFSAASAVLE